MPFVVVHALLNPQNDLGQTVRPPNTDAQIPSLTFIYARKVHVSYCVGARYAYSYLIGSAVIAFCATSHVVRLIRYRMFFHAVTLYCFFFFVVILLRRRRCGVCVEFSLRSWYRRVNIRCRAQTFGRFVSTILTFQILLAAKIASSRILRRVQCYSWPHSNCGTGKFATKEKDRTQTP